MFRKLSRGNEKHRYAKVQSFVILRRRPSPLRDCIRRRQASFKQSLHRPGLTLFYQHQTDCLLDLHPF